MYVCVRYNAASSSVIFVNENGQKRKITNSLTKIKTKTRK